MQPDVAISWGCCVCATPGRGDFRARMLLCPNHLVPDDKFIDPINDRELLHQALARLRTFDFVGIVETVPQCAVCGAGLDTPSLMPGSMRPLRSHGSSDPLSKVSWRQKRVNVFMQGHVLIFAFGLSSQLTVYRIRKFASCRSEPSCVTWHAMAS